VCYTVAAYNFPDVVHFTWGATGQASWDALGGTGRGLVDGGLGLAVRMTRRGDLGLGELLFPGQNFNGDAEAEQ
jgi:hypothetical protein